MRSRLILVAAVVACLAGIVSTALAGPEKVSPLLRKYTNPGLAVAFDYVQSMRGSGIMEGAAGTAGIRCLVQGNVTRGQLEALGISVGTQAGTVFTATVPADKLTALSNLPGIVRIDPAQKCKPNLDNATLDTKVRAVHGPTTAPPWTGNTGAGVLVGSVDSGVDYTHEDFKTSTGFTRFDRIWDQTVAGTPPSGFAYGTEWTSAQIDAGTPTVTNPDGHGSHVLGILGGDGSSSGGGSAPAYTFTGVAPAATLVTVKTDFYDTSIIDGVHYIFQRAAALGIPAVVNISLGSQTGPHDGTDPFEVGLDALTGPGKIIVTSASNDRGAGIHARGTVPVSGSPSALTFQLTVDPYSPTPQAQNDLVFFTGWYPGADNYTITVVGPGGKNLTQIKGGSNAVSTTDGAIEIDNGTTTPLNGDTEVFIALYDAAVNRPPASGTWTITFTRMTSSASNIDAWMYYSTMGARFTSNVTDDVTIGNPACAPDLITVGAYATKTSWPSRDGHVYQWNPVPTLNDLADFSGRGPTRTGGQKPDISAPGFGVVSVLSDDVPINTSTAPLILPGDLHWIQAGTSMSSPMVAGVAALIMAKDGALTPAQVKTKLQQFARTDTYTGGTWNADWGWGKLNAEPADVLGPTVTISSPNGGGSYQAGQTVSVIWFASDNFSVAGVDLYYSTDGGATFPNLIVSGTANDGIYAWTVPSVATTQARIRAVAHDSVDNTGQDDSDANFTILAADTTPPSVAVLAPNGGESFDLGSTTNITWNASDTGMKPGLGPLAAIAGVDSVSIWYSLDDGSSWVLEAHGEDNDGTYSWTVPGTISDSVLVKVAAWDPSGNMGEDQSDAVFTVSNQTGIEDLPPPTVLSLAQNRPNPLRGALGTRIVFGLPDAGHVRLRIYDVRGSLVATLADRDYSAGYQAIRWDGRGNGGAAVPAGLYFYRLETAQGTLNRKLIVVR